MLDRIKLKAFFVFLTIHAGLLVSIYALYRTAQIQDARGILGWLIAGTAGLYGGLVMAALFLYLPAAPWIHRARRILSWKTWLQEDLPQILVAIPAVVAALTAVVTAVQQATQASRPPGKPKGSKRNKAA